MLKVAAAIVNKPIEAIAAKSRSELKNCNAIKKIYFLFCFVVNKLNASLNPLTEFTSTNVADRRRMPKEGN